jgi:HEAT repeat protein
MMEVVVVILVVGAGLFGVLASLQQSDERVRAWQDAARSCGLRVEEAISSSVSPQLKARAGPVEVRIEAGGEKGRLTQISVNGPAPPGFHYLKIRRESLFHLTHEIQIGDRSFDSTFFIEGPARLVLALLDAETRSLLSRLNAESQMELSWSELRAEMADENILDVLPLLLEVRRRLVPPVDIPRRLAENARQDPEAGVRLQNLLLLLRELPDDPGTAEVLRAACSDPNPEIRLRAARELGAEGRAILLEIAKDLRDDAASAEAVSLLDRELPLEPARSILVQALSLRRFQTARACLGVLGRSGAAAVDALAQVSASKDVELAAAAAEALGATGSQAAEAPLIAALRREQTALQVAAANALGRVGSVTAVLPLKEANEHVWLDPKVRRATRQAVAEIQARAEGASPGQLSLAGAETGQLSLADDPAGRLSLPPGERPE